MPTALIIIYDHHILHPQTFTGIPLVAANMDTTGTFEMATVLAKSKAMTAMHKYYDVEDWSTYAAEHPESLPYLAVSAGTSQADFATVTAVTDAVPGVQTICLDVANGYSEHFVDAVRRYREAFPTHTMYAGNVVSGEMVEELLLSGADVVKVGIGPGSVCTTRKQTGVGYPQLSAVLECADAAHGLNGHIISDGGCTCPGDVAKAFGAGADFVMLGGMLAGHDESGGEIVERNGNVYKKVCGSCCTSSVVVGVLCCDKSLLCSIRTPATSMPRLIPRITPPCTITMHVHACSSTACPRPLR